MTIIYHLHNGHQQPHDPTSIPIPPRLLDEEEEETIKHGVESACNNAAGRNYMFKQMGKFISSMKVAYLNCMETKSNSKEDDIDSMFSNFEKSNEIHCTTLSDVPTNAFLDNTNFSVNDFIKESLTVSTTKNIDEKIINSPVSKMASIKAIETFEKNRKL